MTGEEQQIEPDFNEEAMRTDSDVPDPQEERSMVATSAEVYTCFLVSDCSFIYRFFLCFAVLQSAICHIVWLQALEELGLDAVDLVDEAPSFFESTSQEYSE